MAYSIAYSTTNARLLGCAANLGFGASPIVGVDLATGFGAVWSADLSTKTALPSLSGWLSSKAYGVDMKAQVVVGSAVNASSVTIPVVWFLSGGTYTAHALPVVTNTEGEALGVSDDGLRIIGWADSIFGTQAPFIWVCGSYGTTPTSGTQGPTSGIPGLANIAGISGDGTLWSATYRSSATATQEAYIFAPPTSSPTSTNLPDSISPTDFGWYCQGCSKHGDTIVGGSLNSGAPLNKVAYQWDKATQTQVALAAPAGTTNTGAFNCSDDGSIVVGLGINSSNTVGIVWTSGTAAILPTLASVSGTARGTATDIIGSGTTIVGYGNDSSGIANGIVWTGPAPTTDPLYSDTLLLVHFDGASGQTTFTDDSHRAGTLSQATAGVSKVNTSTVKWGTGSLDPGGGTGGLTISNPQTDFDFLTGDFTIEAWVYASSAPSVAGVVTRYAANGWFFGYIFGDLSFWFTDATAGLTTWSTTQGITTGGWHHIAVDRTGSTLTLYFDGTPIGTQANTAFASGNSNTVEIGNDNSTGRNWPGFIDDVRVTGGVARYAGISFTPPSAPFPGGGGSPPPAGFPAGMFFG